MNAILATLIQRPRTVLTISLLLIVAGITTYVTIAKESSPNIAMPMVSISVVYEGVSAEDSESLLIKPLENELRDLDNVKTMMSEATEGHAGITIEFYSGTDEDNLLVDVREKVDKAKVKFPNGVDEPSVEQLTAANTEVILTLVLSGQQSYRSLLQQAEQLKKRLELLPEILEVELVGDSDEVIDVEIDPVKIQSYQLDIASVTQLIQASSSIVPAGSVDSAQGSLSLKIPTTYRTPEDVLSQPVVVDQQRVLLLKDIADVRLTHKKADQLTWLNGERSVELRIFKKAGENILDTVDFVKDETETLKKQWPASTKVTYLHDLSVDVQDMIGDLQSSILSSVVLVIIVLVAALGVRSALLVGLSIPISFLTGILLLNALGHSVNMVVLFSLIMAVGMLVDGAIVVIELAQRKLQQGLNATRAYIEAAQQMAWPISASTATTLSAFIPLLFWPGFFGEFMKYLPITLIATLSASLVVALVIIPTLGRLMDGSGGANEELPGAVDLSVQNSEQEQVHAHAYQGIGRYYMPVLERLIQHPGKVVQCPKLSEVY